MRFIASNNQFISCKIDNEELLDIVIRVIYGTRAFPYPILEHLLKRHSVDLNGVLLRRTNILVRKHIEKIRNDYYLSIAFLQV